MILGYAKTRLSNYLGILTYKNIFISGACFLRTDQMDGETDWKLRLTVPPCQRLPCDDVSEMWVWNEVLLIRKRHDYILTILKLSHEWS